MWADPSGPHALSHQSSSFICPFAHSFIHSFRLSSITVLVFCGTLCSVLGSLRGVTSFIAYPTPPPETHHLVEGIRDRPATLMPDRVTCVSSDIGQWSLPLWVTLWRVEFEPGIEVHVDGWGNMKPQAKAWRGHIECA